MLGLREKLTEAPFLKGHGMDGRAFIEPPQAMQAELISGE